MFLCKRSAAAVTLDTQNAAVPQPSGVNYPWLNYKPGDRYQSFLLIACDCRL